MASEENITITKVEYETLLKYKVEKIRRPKYVVESNDEHTSIVIAEMPKLPIPKGNTGASLLAWILISKFFDHLPFFRQQQIFKRMGLIIAESTINGWFSAACRLLVPLYEVLKAKVLLSSYLMSDDTPVRVLTRDKPGTTHRGFHWAYCAPVERLALFDYQKSRSREGPEKILTPFQGYLQTDGYEVCNYFENQPGITLLACIACPALRERMPVVTSIKPKIMIRKELKKRWRCFKSFMLSKAQPVKRNYNPIR